MKKFDAASKKLIWVTTALCFGTLMLPLVTHFLRKRQVDQIWAVKGVFDDQMNIVCQDDKSLVRTFDGVNLADFDLKNGSSKSKPWVATKLPSLDFALTPDGAKVVGIVAASRTKRQNQLWVRDVSSKAVTKRIDLKNSRYPQGIYPMVSIYFLTKRYVVTSYWNEVGRSKGKMQVVDLFEGNAMEFARDPDYEECGAFAASPQGELFFGWLDKNELQFQPMKGKSRKLPLDERDWPGSQRQPWGYFLPTTLFNRQGSLLFASIQFEDSLRAKQKATGSVCAWDWKKGTLQWRWQQDDVQPVKLALSPDQKLLAVGCTVVLPTTYRRGVRLLILDARTGTVKQEFFRDRGGSQKWQQLAEKVRRTPDEFFPSGYNVPTVTGLSWTADSASLIAAYADDELIRWRVH